MGNENMVADKLDGGVAMPALRIGIERLNVLASGSLIFGNCGVERATSNRFDGRKLEAYATVLPSVLIAPTQPMTQAESPSNSCNFLISVRRLIPSFRAA